MQREGEKMRLYEINMGILGALLVVGVVAMGCAPVNLIFVGVNTESSFYDIFTMADTVVPSSGESWHGGLAAGETFIFYSRTDSIPAGGRLQVYNAFPGYLGIPGGYVDVTAYPQTAQLIRDKYLKWYPTPTAFFLQQLVVSWADVTTQFPKYQIVVYPRGISSNVGMVHKIEIQGAVGGFPIIRVVDAANTQVGAIDPIGRRILLRQVDGISVSIIVSHNMSINPTPPYPVVPNPSISTDSELGYIAAGVIQEITPGCFNGPLVPVKTNVNYDPMTNLYTYQFLPTQPLVSGANYIFVLGTQAPFGMVGPGGPPEKLTQGLMNSLIPLECSDPSYFCPPGRPAMDLGILACSAPSNTYVYQFYFQASATWWGDFIPPAPPGTLIPGVSSHVIPRYIECKDDNGDEHCDCREDESDDDVAVIITCPPGYDCSTIDDVDLACAKPYRIHTIEQQNSVIAHFHKHDMCKGEVINRVIRVSGKTRGGFVFVSHDTLQHVGE